MYIITKENVRYSFVFLCQLFNRIKFDSPFLFFFFLLTYFIVYVIDLVFFIFLLKVQVPENVGVGTVIGSVEATDADSGQLGSQGIRYSLLPGSIADALEIDPLSGAVSIGKGASGLLDREKVSQLIVMVEARDSLGLGNR